MKKPVVRDLKKKVEHRTEKDISRRVVVANRPENIFSGMDIGTNTGMLSSLLSDSDFTAEMSSLAKDLQDRLGTDYEVVSVKKAQGLEPQASNQNPSINYQVLGVPHPINYLTVKSLKDISPHHSACIEAKVNASIGLGFVSDSTAEESISNPSASVQQDSQIINDVMTGQSYVVTEADKALDPLCFNSFYHNLSQSVEDFFDCGTGYMEVVRRGTEIKYINWIPVEDLYVFLVQDKGNADVFIFYRYVYASSGSYSRYFCPFGLENKKKCNELLYNNQEDEDNISEVIDFIDPSNRCRWYGYPKWLSAVPEIDLFKRTLQYKSDYYTNRGVLDYILAVSGDNIDSDEWAKIEEYIQSSVGGGNNFKALALKLATENTIELLKLASDGKKEEQSGEDCELLSRFIVSAHRVPPILANILVSGKLGAANETVQAIIAFQLLCIGKAQRIIQSRLASTLGGPEGVKGLTPESFRLKTITSQLNIKGLDAASRTKEEASAQPDRDFNEGLKD